MIYRIFNNRWVTFGIAFIICALVFWHANKFFHELKENETSKMQIWAAAQQELQQMDIDSENLSPTAFNVLLSNNTTPMRSEERRVGKECRCGNAKDDRKK